MAQKKKYVVKKIVNSPRAEVTHDVYLKSQEGFEFVAEFTAKSDARLFAKAKNAKLKGARFCT